MHTDQKRAIADDGVELTANLSPRRAAVWLPEISLVAAVFKDAVRCAQRAGGGVTHEQSAEALEWIASERSDWAFSFVNVCDVLGMDVDAVRKSLQGDGHRHHRRDAA